MIPITEFLPAVKALVNLAKEPFDCVLFEFITQDAMTMTASNGHGLLHTSWQFEHAVTPGQTFLIDAKDALSLRDMAAGIPDDAHVSIVIYDTTILFMSGTVCQQYERRGIAADFPDYRPLLRGGFPASNDGKISIDCGIMSDTISPLLHLTSQHNQMDLTVHVADCPTLFNLKLIDDLTALRSARGLIMPMVNK